MKILPIELFIHASCMGKTFCTFAAWNHNDN